MKSATLADKAPLLIAAILVIAGIVAYMNASSNTNVGAAVLTPNNTSTDAANAQIAASNAASAQAYNQTTLQEFGQMVGFGTAIQQNATNVQLAGISAGVQDTQYNDQMKTQIANYNAMEQISANQLTAQQTQYNDQLSAIQGQQHVQQQQNFWNGAFSLIGAAFGI